VSGIAAIFNRDGAPVAPEAIDRMLAKIAHRGRDSLGRWIGGDGQIALGHATMRTTPESIREEQPYRDETGSIALTFDGRIDNRDDMIPALIAAGAILRNDTDAEIILRAYLVWGDEAPLKLIGDFAMVIWDGRNRRLFCARDPFGVRPFYYHLSARTFVCGTELREVLDASGIVRQPNEGMVAEYLAGAVTNRDETLFAGIMRLPASYCMIVSADDVRIRRYFDLDFHKKIRYRTDDQYAEHLLAIMKETVRVRMRAIGGIECDLSGGLDSSSITALAMGLMRDGSVSAMPFETVTTDFVEPESDERHYVDDVIAMLGVTAHRDTVEIPGLSERWEQAQRYLDVPDSGTALSGTSLRDLSQRGFRVSLGGAGGDEWLDGSSSYNIDLLKRLRFLTLVRALRISAAVSRAEGSEYSYVRGFIRSTVLPMMPENLVNSLKKMTGRPVSDSMWLTPALARRVDIDQRLHGYERQIKAPTNAQFDEYLAFVHGWPSFAFEIVERTYAWEGFEPRHPFWDRRLVEFAFAMPEEQRRGPNQSKFAMRNAMRGLIPESVRTRFGKGDFSHVLVQIILKLGGAEFFRSLSIAQAGWVDGEKIRSLYAKAEAAFIANDRAFRGYAWPLTGIADIELWYRAAFGSAD